MTVLIVDETGFKGMVTELAKPGEAIIADLTPRTAHLLHMAVGIRGEVDELESALYALIVHGIEDRPNIVEELGDTEFYYEGALQGMLVLPPSVREEEDGMCLNLEHIRAVSLPAARILNYAKKLSVHANTSVEEKLASALAELRVGLDVLYAKLGVTHEEAIHANMQKLKFGNKARYANGYSDAAAQARADKDGQD